MADDFQVRVGIQVDESKLNELDNKLKELSDGKTILLKINTEDSKNKIKELFNYAKTVFNGLNKESLVPNFADPKVLKNQLTQIKRAVNQVRKVVDSGISPTSLLSGDNKTFGQIESQLRKGLQKALTDVGNIKFASDAFNIDTSSFGKLSNNLIDIRKYINDFNTAARESGLSIDTLADGSVRLSQNIQEVATNVVQFNSAGEQSQRIIQDMKGAFEVVSEGANTLSKVLSRENKVKIYDSIKESLEKAGIAFDESEEDIDKYITKVVSKLDSAGKLMSASIQASIKGINLNTYLSTEDIGNGNNALIARTAQITDNSQVTNIKSLQSEYRKLISLQKEYNTAAKNGNTDTLSVLSKQIQEHEEKANAIKNEIKNQEELTRITKEYGDALDRINASESDKSKSERDTQKITDIKTTLSQLETYQNKINSLRNSGNFSDNQIKEYENEINRLIKTVSELGIAYDSAINKFSTTDLNTNNILETQRAFEKLIQILNEFKTKTNLTDASQTDYVGNAKIREAINLLEALQKKKLELAKTKISGGTDEYIAKLEADIKKLEKALDAATKAQTSYNKTVGDSKQYTTAFEKSVEATDDALAKMKNSAEMAGNSTKDLNKGFDGLVANGLKMAASFAIFDKLQDVIYQSVEAVQELDRTMTGLQMVTEKSDAQITGMMHNYANMARDLGVTLQTVAEGSEEWLKCWSL